MSESQEQWQGSEFWEQLGQLEQRHQRARSAHEMARRKLARVSTREAQELQQAWRCYCEVLAELDSVTAEFGALRP